jgi:hypothetical protein
VAKWSAEGGAEVKELFVSDKEILLAHEPVMFINAKLKTAGFDFSKPITKQQDYKNRGFIYTQKEDELQEAFNKGLNAVRSED